MQKKRLDSRCGHMRKMIVDETIIPIDDSTAHFSQICLAGNKYRPVHTIISAMPIMIVLHLEPTRCKTLERRELPGINYSKKSINKSGLMSL